MAEDLSQQLVEQQDKEQSEQAEALQPSHIEVAYHGGDDTQAGEAITSTDIEEPPVPDAEEPTHLGSIDHTEDPAGESKLWGEQKALAIGTALNEEGEFDKPSRNMQALRELREYEESRRPSTHPDSAYDRNLLENSTRRGNQEIIDAKSSPYEELYDSNPELFANMPTSQFIKSARELVKAKSDLDSIDTHFDRLNTDIKEYQNFYDQGKRMDHRAIVRILSHVGWGLELAADDFQSQIDQVFENEFDKTPRQLMEDTKALFDNGIVQLQERKKVAQSKIGAIFDKYKPTEPHDDVSA